MSDFSDFDSAVIEFMDDFGFQATFLKQNGPQDGSNYNPSTGQNAVVTVSIPVRAILTDLKKDKNGLSTKTGCLVMAGDKLMYMQPPEKNDPLQIPLVINTSTDRIIAANVTYKIENVKSINTTGSNAVLYLLHLRR